MKLRNWVASLAALGGLLASGAAFATLTVSVQGAWSGTDFVVSDINPVNGSDSSGQYLAAFHLHYDASILKYGSTLPLSSSAFVIAPDLTATIPDPDPAGDIFIQVLASDYSTLPSTGELFKVLFSPVAANPGDSIVLNMTISNESVNVGPNNVPVIVAGGYGTLADPVNGVPGFDPVPVDPVTWVVPQGGTVPEPAGLALTGIALAGLLAARRRAA